MTTYNLTKGDDTITGTANADTFEGTLPRRIGGIDTLNGEGGNDKFILGGYQFLTGGNEKNHAYVDGGEGDDTIVLDQGHHADYFISAENVENLDITTASINASTEFLASFDNIYSSNLSANYIGIVLNSNGKFINFSPRITNGQSVHVYGEYSDSELYIKMTNEDDLISGSQHDDVIDGADGNDYIYFSEGKDILDGGNGNDTFSTFFTYSGGSIVDGGAGIDNFLAIDAYIPRFSVKNVENLILEGLPTVRLEFISLFDNVEIKGATGLQLVGAGGEFDFSKIRALGGIDVRAEYATSGVRLIGTAHFDRMIGTEFADVLQGGDNTDVLDGGGGNDVLIGGVDYDDLSGGDGVDRASYAGAASGVTASLTNRSQNSGEARGDTYNSIENLTGSAFSDTLEGDNSANHIDGGSGDDTLSGLVGDDKLFGGDGNDLLNGGIGPDYLSGGTGNDRVSYAGAATGVSASLTDSSLNTGEAKGDTYNSIENLTGSAFNDTLDANASRNHVDGGAGNDTLSGLAGDDTLFGGEGNDTLRGGLGADYLSGGVGTDTASYKFAAAGVAVSLTDPSINTGEAKGDTFNSIENLFGSNFNDRLTGNSAANAIQGSAGNDTLASLSGDDRLDGGIGNDVLEGGIGADSLNGGDGVDVVSYACSATGIVANLANASINTGEAAGDAYVAIENLRGSAHNDFLNGNNGSNKLFGGNGNDILVGGNDADYLSGGLGTDTASYADATAGVGAFLVSPEHNQGIAAGDTYNSIENLTGSSFDDILEGNSSSNVLVGGNGNDTLSTGFRGRDELYGGDGDDTLFTVNETYDRGVFNGGAGNDTLIVEHANLVGRTIVEVEKLSVEFEVVATIDILSQFQQISGSMVDGIVIELEGSGGTLDFSKSATNGVTILTSTTTSGYTLIGTSKRDYLRGSAFNDVLQGGKGMDSISGGSGNDTVSYSLSNAGVTIDLRLDFQDYSLGDAKGDYIRGIENVIGSGFADSLTGNEGDNRLFGGSGNDRLVGRLGNDHLAGEAGLDTVSYADAVAAVNVNLANSALNTGEAKGDTYNSIEGVEGSAFSDTLDGDAGDNVLAGLDHMDVLNGGAGNDTLLGGEAVDRLNGGDGNDILIGGADGDHLDGGKGSDTASFSDAANGVEVSLADPDGDAVADLFVSIENLEGSAFNDILIGDAANNAISGLNGSDVIEGGLGADKLSGGTGKDGFVFSTALGASNVDTITDFSATDDTIRLANTVFKALKAIGPLAVANFSANATGLASDADDRILYETDTGKLFYDADGNGAGVAVQFATLTGLPSITAADFQVV
ncbi:calcium-binding protein [Mesorhizobium sp. CN2-181]|uniref:beta strand repeat-containing protein n=1 Tax=Mesorhizobium yinganensis TaxID=3157707 RepID=UPI0032B73685